MFSDQYVLKVVFCSLRTVFSSSPKKSEKEKLSLICKFYDPLIWVSVSLGSAVGSTWRPYCANWASARPWFNPKWQLEPARLSWPTPSTSSLLPFASASRWCQFLSSFATSERLDSLKRLRPDDFSALLLMKQTGSS